MLKLLTRSVALMAVTLTLCFSVVAGAVDTQQMEPFYKGIASMQPSVVISSSGSANCLDKVLLKSGYTANVTWTLQTSVYKGYKQDKIEMRGDRAEMSDFPLYLNTVAGGLDRRDQTIGGFSFVVKIYAVPVVEIIG